MKHPKTWVTRDGRRLAPRCMSCSHLRNCINRILRLRWRMEWLSILLAELNRRCVQPKPTKAAPKKEPQVS